MLPATARNRENIPRISACPPPSARPNGCAVCPMSCATWRWKGVSTHATAALPTLSSVVSPDLWREIESNIEQPVGEPFCRQIEDRESRSVFAGKCDPAVGRVGWLIVCPCWRAPRRTGPVPGNR